jgi:hypothetical protein
MRLRTACLTALVLTGFLTLPAHAAGCVASGVRGRDPGRAALNAELDRAAARRKVPPYLMKAVAWHESRWAQFHADGHVALSPACAIGVMQVLPRGWDGRRLATDYRYNIDAGAQMLAAKMAASSANVPRSLGADDRRVAENWYRAAYRYNGSGSRAVRYADVVFATIASPPNELRPWMVPVPVSNPRSVVRGYSPTSGAAYVARLDGTWRSTLGTFRRPVNRGDFLAGAARTSAGRALEGDQPAGAIFLARNLGWETWTTSRVSLSTYPVGRASRLRHPRWVAPTRPVSVAAATPPGADGRFGFSVQAHAGSSSATVAEGFVPVLDGTISLGAHTASSWTLHPVAAPAARIVSAPAYVTDSSTDSSAKLGLAFSDPSPGSGVAYVEVARRAPGSDTWTSSRVTSTAPRVPLTGAGAHAVRVRAVDNAGHASAWTDPATVVVPRDNTSADLTFAGAWSTPAVGGSWLGSVATATEGASVSTTVNGASYALIGTRGPGLARLSVYLDDVLVTVVDPTADTTAQRQVLWSAPLPPGDHVLRVSVGDATASRTSSAPGDAPPGPPAYLDAIAVA